MKTKLTPFERYAISAFAASFMLTGCGGSQSPIGVPGAFSQRAATKAEFAHAVAPKANAKTLLLIAEQGSLKGEGLVEIYSAPFTGPPQRLRIGEVFGLAIAPNGDLIVGNARGLLAYKLPWTGKGRLFYPEQYPSGMLLFDSKARLYDIDFAFTVYAFDPPYKSRSLYINDPGGVGSSALDSKNNLFLAAPPVSSKIEVIYKCQPINYSSCKSLRNGGSVGIDQKDNLFTDLGSNVLGEFRPPYGWRDETASVTLPFSEGSITSTPAGAIVVTGWDTRINYHLGVFLHSIKGPMKELPIEQYYWRIPQFSVARNGDLFVSDGTNQKPCVAIHIYPYNGAKYKCIRTKYPVTAVFAQ
jgi:hypothetical protein